MAMRVALVACKHAAEGPWTLAKGNESGLKISRLGEGERIVLVCVIGELKHFETYSVAGTFDLPLRRMEKYRIIKEVDEGASPSPTTVEIVLNGKS